MHVSERVAAKAQRLSEEGKVTHIKGHRYTVQGDSGTYSVYVADAQEAYGFCNCPAETLLCSHLIAAAAFEQANPLLPVGVPALRRPVRRTMKSRPLSNDELARRQLNHKGYLLVQGQIHYVTDEGAVYLSEMCGDATETLQRLEQAGWPTVEGEIPCDECGDLQPQLGGLCLRCQANYHNVE